MKEKERIRENLLDILINKYKVNIDKKDSNYDLNLLGRAIKMGAIDLMCFFLDVEKEFNITVPEEDIVKGTFKTINAITQLIYEKVQC
jgi:peptide maturation system acyl carrier-related protein